MYNMRQILIETRIIPLFHSGLYFCTHCCSENVKCLGTVTGVLQYFSRFVCAVSTKVTLYKNLPGSKLFPPFYVRCAYMVKMNPKQCYSF